jgi:hypothetical protein
MTKDEAIAKVSEGALDSAVHDAKSREASDINNGGVGAQLEYLSQFMTYDEIINEAE